MEKLEALKSITTKKELAALLGVKASFLTYNLYIIKPNTQYSKFKIPKKSGGERIINAPSNKLKTLQARLSNLLLDCVDDINKIKFPHSEINKPIKDQLKFSKTLKIKIQSAEAKQQPSLSHGFVRHRSIITNAVMHLGQKNILNIDLNNFFDSFNFGRVRGFFIKNKNFQLNHDIATVIAQIACYNNKLPQGSPCSPVIANLITHALDIRLASLAKKYSCTYTRYADDITFSTRKKEFPSQIMRQEKNEYYSSKNLRQEVERAGFSINDKKTRIQYKDSRQEVTGLVVNKKPSVKSEYWRTVRAQCNNLFNTGKFTKNINGELIPGNINELEGQLNFIDHIDQYNRLRQKPPLNPKYHLKTDALIKQNKAKQRKHLFNNREKTFSQFLFYQLFYANETPTILTEGKTDNTYLKAAIHMLAASFPDLAKVKTATTPYELLVRFVKYSSRTKFLLELYGGTPYLKEFVSEYKNNFIRYKAPSPSNPTIIIVDNDIGPQDAGLLGHVSGIKTAKIFPVNLKLKDDIRKAEFIHLFHNLYLVLTPLDNAGRQTDIESFFSDTDRLRKYKGKCFNTAKARNSVEDLSKEAFATHIIKDQKTTIDFTRLDPLLKRISLVIKHYNSIK